MELSGETAGPSHGELSISFGAQAEDQISIAVSEGGLESSGDENPAALPPSGKVALVEPDPEMTAMLSRSFESVGLEWRPPPCPKPSRLDDWYLGADHADYQCPAPVPFFPEVHKEVTKSWKAPFSSRNLAGTSYPLTTLDGEVAKGYVEIPLLGHAVAMQLCQQSAVTWQGNPHLPTRACKFSSILAAMAYRAAGQATSALHAMALQ